jgi:hypothetical protein
VQASVGSQKLTSVVVSAKLCESLVEFVELFLACCELCTTDARPADGVDRSRHLAYLLVAVGGCVLYLQAKVTKARWGHRLSRLYEYRHIDETYCVLIQFSQ